MEKDIIITNGTGTGELINGTYTVTATVNGYDNTSILPTSLNVTAGVDNYDLTISATGTLTLHVTEDGTSGGTPIVGATFVRTDSAGTAYGTPVTTDSNGDAVFSNMPFAATDAPLIYYQQTASDGDHEFSDAVVNTSMTTSTATVQVINQPGASRTISLTDASYANLPVESGTITLANN